VAWFYTTTHYTRTEMDSPSKINDLYENVQPAPHSSTHSTTIATTLYTLLYTLYSSMTYSVLFRLASTLYSSMAYSVLFRRHFKFTFFCSFGIKWLTNVM